MLAACFASAVAQQVNLVCPAIEITGPSDVTQPGDVMSFIATISPTPANARYVWKTSGGVIDEGQGTQAISLRTTKADIGNEITATIAIVGLPPICNHTASAKGSVAQPPPWCVLDEWGLLPLNDQRGRLDNFFTELLNRTEYLGLFYVSTEKKEGPQATSERMQFVLRHAKFRKFDKNRLIFALTDEDRHNISLYLYRPGQWEEISCKPPCKLIYGRDLK